MMKFPRLLSQAQAEHIFTLIESGRAREAEPPARKLIAEFPRHGWANYLLARALVEQGKKGEALPFAENAVKFSPNEPALLVFLGRLFTDLGLLEFVLPLLEKARRLLPSSAWVSWALAHYWFAAGAGDKARQYYQDAMKLTAKGGTPSEITADFARCLVALGEIDQAEALYTTIKADKRHYLKTLLELAGLRKHGADSSIAQELRQALEKPGLNVDMKSQIILALGRIEENSGNFDGAFALFTESRDLLGSTFDARESARTVAQISGFYSQDIVNSLSPHGSDSELPVFVVGMPRSGTTLTEQIIAAHRDAHGLGELGRMHWLELGFRKAHRGSGSAGRMLAAARSGELKARADEGLAFMRKLAPDGLRLVDKNPLNFRNLGFIHACFPKARIIFCRRHPADNFISAFQNLMNRDNDYAYDQRTYANYYRDHERLMAHWKTCFPESIFELRYEELVADPESESRKLIGFLGLPWDENCLNFSENKTTVTTFSKLQVRSQMYSSSVGRWKNYEKHLGPFFEALNQP